MPNWEDLELPVQLPAAEPDQTKAPLWEELRRYAENPLLPFHTPGHKKGMALENGWDAPGLLPGIDLTEIAALRWAESWEEAEALAARFFKADRSFFLVQGASQGVMASLLGAFSPGDAVLVARDCHASVIHGMILAGLNPIFIENAALPGWRITAGLDPDSLQIRIREYPDVKGLVVTNPTYQGIARSLAPYRDIIGTERLLIVDEAHGGHFGWMGYQGYDACSQADLWIHGTHKTLGSLTQTGMLHLVAARVEPERIRRSLQLLTTTSPSYILLASLDSNRRFLAAAGHTMFSERLAQVRELRNRLVSLQGLRVAGEPPQRLPGTAWIADPWRICLSFRNFGRTGLEAETAYRDLFKMQPEYADLEQVTFLISPWQEDAPLELLYQATASLWRRYSGDRPGGLKKRANLDLRKPLSLPRAALAPREAALGPVLEVPLPEAAGRIAATVVAPYPPGVPLLIPGEIIRDEDLRFIAALLNHGGAVRGIDSGKITVCRVEK